MCDCYRIGGPFIAEDPDCPTHGTEARAAQRERDASLTFIKKQLESATDVTDLRDVIANLLTLIENDR